MFETVLAKLVAVVAKFGSLAAAPWIAPAWTAIQTFWGFLNSPLGRIVSISLVAMVVWVAGDIHGRDVVMKQWRAANAQAELAARKKDAEVQAWANSRVEAATEDLTKLNLSLQQKVDDYEQTLSANASKGTGSNPACTLDRNDVKRLRGIR